MSEAVRAERFDEQLSAVLSERSPLASVPAELRADIALAWRLSVADFSSESRLRGRPARARPRRRPRVASGQRAAAVLLVSLLAIAVAAAPVSWSFARDALRIVRSWFVGEHTSVLSVDGDFSVTRGPDGTPVISGPQEIESVEEAAVVESPGRIVPFDAAQAATDFRLRMPAEVPEGYAFHGVLVASPTEAQLEFFKLPPDPGLIALLQRRVGAGHAESSVVASADIESVPVMVNGRAALWMDAGEEGLLVWEADGVSYQLAGLNDHEVALRVAQSLR